MHDSKIINLICAFSKQILSVHLSRLCILILPFVIRRSVDIRFFDSTGYGSILLLLLIFSGGVVFWAIGCELEGATLEQGR